METEVKSKEELLKEKLNSRLIKALNEVSSLFDSWKGTVSYSLNSAMSEQSKLSISLTKGSFKNEGDKENTQQLRNFRLGEAESMTDYQTFVNSLEREVRDMIFIEKNSLWEMISEAFEMSDEEKMKSHFFSNLGHKCNAHFIENLQNDLKKHYNEMRYSFSSETNRYTQEQSKLAIKLLLNQVKDEERVDVKNKHDYYLGKVDVGIKIVSYLDTNNESLERLISNLRSDVYSTIAYFA